MSEPRSASTDPRRRGYWLWLVLAALLIAGGYWLAAKQPAQTPSNPFSRRGGYAGMSVPVKIAPVEQGKIDYMLKAVGTVTAYNTVTVRSQVDGELVEVGFDEGGKVEKGDVLARIDPRSYQVALDQALGQQKQNQAQLSNAQRDLQRYQQLYKQNSIARQQVDTQAALVQQLQGAVASDKAAVDSARLQLDYTQITAPISGRLGLRNVDVGNIINASSTDGLVVITQTQPISVLFTLPQAQLPEVAARLREGRTLAVDLFDSTDATRIAQGELAAVDNQIDVATGTVKLKARFENEDESLFPNQFVNVHLRVDTVESLLIPSEAVQQGSIGAFVYVVDEENKVRIQAIKTGRVTDGVTAVASGLQAGQRVVTEGVDRLREGGQVEVMPDSASAADIPSIPAAGLQQQDRSAGARGGQGKASGTDANARRSKREHAAGGQQAAGGAGQKNAAGDVAEAK